MIPVTRTYLPPLEEYIRYLEKIWATGQVTNHGPLVQELETALKEYLGVPSLVYVSNGTLALQLALQALQIQGEVITTPFSYVATTNAILWEHCQPVFVDIDPHTGCLDPGKIEAAITSRTRAILAVHVYGFPCQVEAISALAEKYDLKVIYDAAHAFGTRLNGVSLLNFGDVSTLSFHATKLFHTVEGGAVIARDPETADVIDKLKSFGQVGEEYFLPGVNAKSSEFHAAMGLCVLPQVAGIIQDRRRICESYDAEFAGLGIAFSSRPEGFDYNYAYYPILLRDEAQLLRVRAALNCNDIYPRRYFHPSLNTLAYLTVRQACPNAEHMSARVLCLPLYAGLEGREVGRIACLVKDAL